MKLENRLKWVSVVLVVGAGLSWALHRHLEGEAVFAEPRGQLSEVPAALQGASQEKVDAKDATSTPKPGPSGDGVLLTARATENSPLLARRAPRIWAGKEHPGRAELLKQVAFADEVLYRYYVPDQNGPMVQVYAAYSKVGEDRKHHPEICMREAAGAPEDLAFRKIIALDPEGKRTVQRFRFLTGTGAQTVIYYWHCTFPARVEEGQTALQHIHRRLSTRSPSITIQVSTAAQGDDLEIVERDYLPALDAALAEKVLPTGTTIGCDRLPVLLLRR